MKHYGYDVSLERELINDMNYLATLLQHGSSPRSLQTAAWKVKIRSGRLEREIKKMMN